MVSRQVQMIWLGIGVRSHPSRVERGAGLARRPVHGGGTGDALRGRSTSPRGGNDHY